RLTLADVVVGHVLVDLVHADVATEWDLIRLIRLALLRARVDTGFVCGRTRVGSGFVSCRNSLSGFDTRRRDRSGARFTYARHLSIRPDLICADFAATFVEIYFLRRTAPGGFGFGVIEIDC